MNPYDIKDLTQYVEKFIGKPVKSDWHEVGKVAIPEWACDHFKMTAALLPEYETEIWIAAIGSDSFHIEPNLDRPGVIVYFYKDYPDWH